MSLAALSAWLRELAVHEVARKLMGTYMSTDIVRNETHEYLVTNGTKWQCMRLPGS
jgi:hypothetical protein